MNVSALLTNDLPRRPPPPTADPHHHPPPPHTYHPHHLPPLPPPPQQQQQQGGPHYAPYPAYDHHQQRSPPGAPSHYTSQHQQPPPPPGPPPPQRNGQYSNDLARRSPTQAYHPSSAPGGYYPPQDYGGGPGQAPSASAEYGGVPPTSQFASGPLPPSKPPTAQLHQQPPPPPLSARHLPPPHPQDHAHHQPPPPHGYDARGGVGGLPPLPPPPPTRTNNGGAGHKPRRSYEKLPGSGGQAGPPGPPPASSMTATLPPGPYNPDMDPYGKHQPNSSSKSGKRPYDDRGPRPDSSRGYPGQQQPPPPPPPQQQSSRGYPPAGYPPNGGPPPPPPQNYAPMPPQGNGAYGPPQNAYGPPPPGSAGYGPPPPNHYAPPPPPPQQQQQPQYAPPPPQPQPHHHHVHHHHVHHHGHHHHHQHPPPAPYDRSGPPPPSRGYNNRQLPEYASAQQLQHQHQQQPQPLPPPGPPLPDHPHHHHHHHHPVHPQAQPQPQPHTPQQLQTSAVIVAGFKAALHPSEVARLPNLGTFVYPNLPFPVGKVSRSGEGELLLMPSPTVITPKEPESDLPKVADEEQDAEKEKEEAGENVLQSAPFFVCTVLVGSGYLFAGAGAVPKRLDGGFKLWGSQSYGGYTDDSDLRLILLHSGFLSVDDMARARAENKDLRVRLRIGRHPRARYIGGPAESASGSQPPRKKQRTASNEERNAIKSFAWGNGHDGGSLEVVSVDIVKRGSAHSKHVPNRKARLAQFARARARLNMAPPPVPSSSSNQSHFSPVSESDTLVHVEDDGGEVRECAKWTLVLGGLGAGKDGAVVYDPEVLREVLWGGEEKDKRRAVELENADERYVLVPSASSSTYTIHVHPHPHSKEAEPSRVLAKDVAESDVQFTKDGVCVWFYDDASASTAPNKEKQKSGWVCKVLRWRYTTPTAEAKVH